MDISTFVLNSVLVNGKRDHGLDWSSYSKPIVGAVVVGWKEAGVKPPDNVWTREVLIWLAILML